MEILCSDAPEDLRTEPLRLLSVPKIFLKLIHIQAQNHLIRKMKLSNFLLLAIINNELQ